MADTNLTAVTASYNDVNNAIESLLGNIGTSTSPVTKGEIANFVSGVGNNTDGQVKSVVFAGGAQGDRTKPSVVDESNQYVQLARSTDLSNYISGVGNTTDGKISGLVFHGGDITLPSIIDSSGTYHQLFSGTNSMEAGDQEGIGIHTDHKSGRPTYGDANGWRNLALESDLSSYISGTYGTVSGDIPGLGIHTDHRTGDPVYGDVNGWRGLALQTDLTNYVNGLGNSTDGQVRNAVFAGGGGGDRSKPAFVDESGAYQQLALASTVNNCVLGVGNNTDAQVKGLVFAGGDTNKPSVITESGEYHQLLLNTSGVISGTYGTVSGDIYGLGIHTNRSSGRPTYGDSNGWRDLALASDISSLVSGVGNSTDGQVKGLVFSGNDTTKPTVIDESNNYHQLFSGNFGMAGGDVQGIGIHTNHSTGHPTYGDLNGWRDLALSTDFNSYAKNNGNNTDGEVQSVTFASGAGGDRSKPTFIDGSNQYIQLVPASAFSASFSNSGWTKLPNGIIFQWMYLQQTTGSFNFPITFPNAAFGVYATNADAQGTNVDNAFAYLQSNSSFFCQTKQSVNNNSFSQYSCYIFAVGW